MAPPARGARLDHELMVDSHWYESPVLLPVPDGEPVLLASPQLDYFSKRL